MTPILLGQSYYLRFDPKLWQAMQPYPPLGTLYAASYLRQHGYEVALFDAMQAESEMEWGQALAEHKPQIAVLYEDNFNYLSKMCLLRMRQAAYAMIAMAKEHGCTVILCGADATDHPEEYLSRGADYVLLGEGEETLLALLDRLTGKSSIPLEGIFGLVYKDGEVRRNPRRPDMRDLDSLPFPAWDLVDVPRYRRIWLERSGYFSMNMVSTRGCPFHCNWCAKPIWGQRYNTRSPENVVAELIWLKETYAPDHICFADDIFGLKPGWLPRFARAVEEQSARVPFKCLSRVDLLLRPGEVAALRLAGAQTVWMGAESGSQKILDAMDKGTRVEQIYAARQLLCEVGIQACFFLQFGYPGETHEDIEKTRKMVYECDPDDIGISVSYPMPGTKFYSSVQSQLGTVQNWQDSSDLAMLYHGAYSTEYYRRLYNVIHSEFRRRKAWRSLQRKLDLRIAVRVARHTLILPVRRIRLRMAERRPNVALVVPHLTHEEAANPTPQERQ